ncbi:hypothetical protein AB9P05_06080 [Roseivirga sp. BDSF3-8]|uniref:hypothetical protein n=1 Tax=Roseivirga sp. BDSF3-8 TaxID=3241598 RepID=UPI003531B2FC
METSSNKPGAYHDATYSSEKLRLEKLLSAYPHCIVDIGQAAKREVTPAFNSKEPLNIMIGLEEPGDLPRVCEILQKDGFVRVKDHEKVFPDQRYFVRLKPRQAYTELEPGQPLPSPERIKQTHHMHVVPLGCRFWQHHIGLHKNVRRSTSGSSS